MAQQEFYTILTAAGLAYEANRKAAGQPIKLTQMSVGDGNGAVYNPDATQTALRREVWRGPINALLQDATNPSYLVGELSLPDDVGGWYVREVGFWTDSGILYAIGKYPESFKPQLVSGAGKEFYIRAIFETSNAESVTLVVDDTVVKATRAYVIDYVAAELAKRDSKNSVRVATTAAITLSGAQSIDGVAVVAGDRVLVKNQASAAQNGIYVAAVGAWSRAADADASIEVTPGLLVPVEAGTANGDSVWQLVTDAPITLGTTALAFEMLAGRTGISAGTYRSVTVDKYGRVTGGTNPTTLAGYGITDALGCRVSVEVEAAGVSWNTIVAEGLYQKILLGTNPDGPGPAQYFYCRTYVRIPVVGGSGALQQFAEPYGTPTGSGQMYWRGLNGTTWTPWVKVMDSTDGASQADAEGGSESSRWMSSLRVFQAMVKYGLGATALPTLTTVADSTTPSGLYQVAGSATGLPVAEDGFVDIRRGGSGLVSQRYFSRTSSRAFFRRGNGSLGAWDEFLHTGLLASQAEVDAGVDDRKYLTPKKLRWGFSISLATNGYVVFPSWLGGLVIQWGKVATPTADIEYAVTFPLAFPTAVFNVLASFGYNDARMNDGGVAQTRVITSTGFSANRQDIGAVNSLPNSYIHYLAVGH
ncbi:hypothetical protein PAERUG_P19_London_7_VIM_2_05_10_05814 [Pseudomonas aeruginosa]|uniref:Phage tail protein n=1 Tax=Pseudomonas aeruginosa TaxID=287 RepID=A0A9P1R8X8_PSEAI|nr:phage tail protein [Pseudomonas aeruginosa]CRP86544.1 hypothetical protein PAERUG_P19_London_7_VIM_2_05_10_05814 [Pseudomonas aeruginosa]